MTPKLVEFEHWKDGNLTVVPARWDIEHHRWTSDGDTLSPDKLRIR
jgi:hypothetical protein